MGSLVVFGVNCVLVDVHGVGSCEVLLFGCFCSSDLIVDV